MTRSVRKNATKKTQKLWNMKGCSKNKSRATLGGKKHSRKHRINCVCKICNLKRRTKRQRGGNCSSCALQMGGCGSCLNGGVGLQMGGSGGINAGGPPFVGKNWSVYSKGNENHYSLNKYQVDPSYDVLSERNQQRFVGGGRKRVKRGGTVPSDLVNLGRSMVFGLGSAYNTLNGFAVPVNPLPYKDQLTNNAFSKV